MRQTVVYLRQCFADTVSRAILANGKDKLSKLARGISCISIVEASGIKQGTRGTINTLEDIVYFFIERETYRWQKLNEGIKKVDRELEKGFNNDREKIDKFWKDVNTFMIERLCRKQVKPRNNVSDEKLLQWIESREPELTFSDLSDYNKKRIESDEVLDQLEKTQQMSINASKTGSVFYSTNFFNMSQSKKPILEAARDEIWKPIVWLHQKQLVDDFIFFTILSELCAANNEKIAFNVKQCFVNFIVSNMPVLITEEVLKNKKYANVGKKTKNWEQPLGIGWKMLYNSNNVYDDPQELDDPPKPVPVDKNVYRPKEWKYLYKNTYDKILLPAAVNNHYEYFKLHCDWGAEINIQDFQGWTPLH